MDKIRHLLKRLFTRGEGRRRSSWLTYQVLDSHRWGNKLEIRRQLAGGKDA